jgi:hypothetical protein
MSRRAPPCRSKSEWRRTSLWGPLLENNWTLTPPRNKPAAKGKGTLSVHAASMEADQKRTSPGALGDVSDHWVSRLLATLTAPRWTKSLPSESDTTRQHQCSCLGVRNTRSFLDWIRARSASNLVSQINVGFLMLVPKTAEGFRATIGTLR